MNFDQEKNILQANRWIASLSKANLRLSHCEYLIEINEYSAAVKILKTVHFLFLDVLKEISTETKTEINYVEIAVNSFIGPIDKVTGKIEKLSPIEDEADLANHKPEMIELIDLLKRNFQFSIKKIREINKVDHPVVFFFKQNRKQILASAAVVLGFYGLICLFTFIYRLDRGLQAEYFKGRDFQKKVFSRRDMNINFNWDKGAPGKGISKDNFSVRWQGTLKVKYPGQYEFQIFSDDGARLIIDDNLVLEDWTSHKLRSVKGVLFLEEGTHPITVEYFEARKKAIIRLLWRHQDEMQFKIISSGNLSPRIAPPPAADAKE